MFIVRIAGILPNMVPALCPEVKIADTLPNMDPDLDPEGVLVIAANIVPNMFTALDPEKLQYFLGSFFI